MENKKFDNLVFESGDLTYEAFERIFYGELFDENKDVLENIGFIVDMNSKNIFLEGITKRFDELNIKYDNDHKTIISILNERFKNILGKELPRTIKEWIKGTPPGVTNRINLYDVCFALEMNLSQTAEFFIKYYLNIPFNYKNREDAIFFYCILNKKDYQTVNCFLEQANDFVEHDISIDTLEIFKNIKSIKDDEKFIKYLSENCISKERQYEKARSIISELLEEVKEITNSKNDSDMIREIFNIDYQALKKEKLIINKAMPSKFVSSLPTAQDINLIIEGKKTYDIIRKTLVILKFVSMYYDEPFYANDEEELQTQIEEYFDDFEDELNILLVDCGFPPIYYRNPFDAIILYCARSKEPIITFWSINENRFIEE